MEKNKNNFKSINPIYIIFIFSIFLIIIKLVSFVLIIISDNETGYYFLYIFRFLGSLWLILLLIFIIYLEIKIKYITNVFIKANKINVAIKHIEKKGLYSKIYMIRQISIYYLTFLGLMNDNIEYSKKNLYYYEFNSRKNINIEHIFIGELMLGLLIALDTDDKKLLEIITEEYSNINKSKIKISNKKAKKQFLKILEVLDAYYNNDYDSFFSIFIALKIPNFKILEKVKYKINLEIKI